MKKGLIAIISVVAVLVIIVVAVIGGYNGLVTAEEDVNNKNSAISTQLQRRAELIPNFVNSVKGYTDYESKTYKDVTEARSAVAGANNAKEQSEANGELNRAISVWVNAVTENYPNLKADAQFIALQDELAGSENRLATARKDYNDAVTKFNSSIRRFPKSIIAGIFGFQKYDYFENDAGTDKVPEVKF